MRKCECKEKDCGDPLGNLTALNQENVTGPSATTYLSTAQVQCFTGYEWTPIVSSKTIQCSPTGWIPMDPCTGVFVPQSLSHYFGVALFQ